MAADPTPPAEAPGARKSLERCLWRNIQWHRVTSGIHLALSTLCVLGPIAASLAAAAMTATGGFERWQVTVLTGLPAALIMFGKSGRFAERHQYHRRQQRLQQAILHGLKFEGSSVAAASRRLTRVRAKSLDEYDPPGETPDPEADARADER